MTEPFKYICPVCRKRKDISTISKILKNEITVMCYICNTCSKKLFNFIKSGRITYITKPNLTQLTAAYYNYRNKPSKNKE